jgi:hypothetical protein
MLPSVNRSIVANFFTPSYRILGRVQVGSSGLLGLLNDPHTSFLSVQEASMARLHEPKTIADRHEEIRVVKQGLVIIAVSREVDLGTQSQIRGGFGHVARHPVRAVTGTFELEGELEWSGRFELSVMLSEGVREFVPLFDATLRAIHYEDLNMKSPAIIFNRKKLDIVRMLKRKRGSAEEEA